MTSTETKSRSSRLTVAIIAAVVLVPIAYLLSIGPAAWLLGHDYIPEDVFITYLEPASFLARHCRPFHQAIEWYASLFTG